MSLMACCGGALCLISRGGGSSAGVASPDNGVAPRVLPVVVAQETGGHAQTFRNSLGMEFVLIPAGEFQMGSSTGEVAAKPPHMVRISTPFYLGKYEVTQAQWHAVMGTNPSAFRFSPQYHPVESVSWDDVQAFLQQLNAREPGLRYRLPTEAEWEYAARGRDGRRYPWGADFDGTRVNFCDRNCLDVERGGFPPVMISTRPPPLWTGTPTGQSPFGAYNMAGNVWEWVQDWYARDAYKQRGAGGAVTVDPGGPATGSYRVIRGGSWMNRPETVQATHRGFQDSSGRHIGVRLVREVS